MYVCRQQDVYVYVYVYVLLVRLYILYVFLPGLQ